MNMASVSPEASAALAVPAASASSAGLLRDSPSIAEHRSPSLHDIQVLIGKKNAPSVLHAEDWTYLAEGGKHVIVAYQPINRTKTPDDYYENTKNGVDGDGEVDDAKDEESFGLCFGRVLRISKSDFVLAFSFSNDTSAAPTSTASGPRNGVMGSSKNNIHHVDYLMDIVAPRLEPYLDIPMKVRVHPSFVQKLYNRIIEHIPESRKDDWKGIVSVSTSTSDGGGAAAASASVEKTEHSKSSDFYGLDEYFIEATMFYNYKQIYALTTPEQIIPSSPEPAAGPPKKQSRPSLKQPHSHPPHHSTNKKTSSICLEIKPKAGYITTSPLVHPDHRAKYSHTRFQILQHLHSQGVVTKGWNKSKLQQVSHYNPMELFSTKKKKALESLFDSPQNNLKVWYDKDTLLYGEHVGSNCEDEDNINNNMYGGDSNGGDNIAVGSSVYRQALAKVFDEYVCESDDEVTTSKSSTTTSTSKTTFKSKVDLRQQLVDMTTHILDNENFLSKLLRLQLLDILDSDGAILVYNHLVKMFDGNADEAEEYLDTPGPLLNQEETSWEHRLPLLSASPYSVPADCSGLWPLCVEIEAFSRKLVSPATRMEILNNEEQMNHIRNKAIGHIGALSKEECRYLLQNWLLSLSMCDVSFFVTISPAESLDMDMHHNRRSSRRRMVSDFAEDTLETLHHQGSLSGQEGILVDSDGSAWYYTIKAVDCDKKPASKLRHRAESESAIKYFEEKKK